MGLRSWVLVEKIGLSVVDERGGMGFYYCRQQRDKKDFVKGQENMKAKMGTLKNVKKERSKMRPNLKVDIKDVREETCALPSI